jgi:signal transduction histidine kinase/DNA-binding NarL/FixJ family response regulator
MTVENSSAYKLLLIDDDEVDVKTFQRTLRKVDMPHQLTMAYNAAEALSAIANQSFDCIFLDYLLPGIDGLQLLVKLREMSISTPVAVMTSQGDEKIAVEMIKNGAFDYFTKSEINPDKISKVVFSAVRLSDADKQRIIAEKTIIENNNRLNAILESTRNLIYAFDKNFKLIAFNSSFKENIEHLARKNSSVTSNIHLNDLPLSEDRKKTLIKNIERSLLGEQFTVLEKVSFSNNPLKIAPWYETTFNPILESNTQVSGVAIYSQDVSENKNIQEDLLQAKNDAVAAAQAKSEFLSNMSHEIRTPMNAIIGLTELLLEENFEGTNLENIKSIKYSADNLLVIINDILDFSKIEAGKVTFENIDFNLRKRMTELRKTFEHRTKEKGIDFKIEVQDAIPAVIKGDPYRLNQILFNLVGNAIKFTSEGLIKVSVNVLAQKENLLTLQFAVEDSGIGIPESAQAKIFESFTQANTNTSRKYGGTGLGLAITKNLVKLQGGEISLKSSVGQGTTFYVTINYSIGNLENLEEKQSKQDQPSDLSALKILLVEDNLMNQFVAKQFFKKWKNEIIVANHGAEAISILIERNDIDIVLMDLQMPEMSGFQAAELIRAQNSVVKNPSIPIIALSADAFIDTRRKVIDAGMNDYITKPFNPEELYSKIIKFSKHSVLKISK